jgi:AcrR family transcriptional regulator
MPNQAFFNLPEDKRGLIISTAVDEFSSVNYDTASINQICRRSKIAKGSFYQYFKDKLDLYVYIMTIAVERKISFFSMILNHSNALTLLEQIRLLFVKGIEFAVEYPQYAALGEQFIKENNEAVKSAVIKEGEKQSEALFSHIIDSAKSRGEVSSKVDTFALGMLLQSLNRAVNDYMQSKSSTDHSLSSKDTVKLVDSLLNIIFNGIKPTQE